MNAVAKNVLGLDFDARQVRVLAPGEYKTAIRQAGLSIEPYSPVVGARVSGFTFDPEQGVDEATRQLLVRSVAEYGFLSFNPGVVRPEDFQTFTKLFGQARFAGNPHAPRVGSSEASALDSAYKKTRTNYIWHIDQAYRPTPQKYTALYALDVPGIGGDTLFSNAVAAYNLLDPLFAAYLETLTVVHDADTQGLLTMAYSESEDTVAQARAKTPPLEVPLVRVHPETGAKQLFATELYAQRILGVSRTISDHLLGIVFDQIRTPEICTYYRWEEGALLIWDNRVVQHRGVYNYAQNRRSLQRAMID